MVAVSFSGMSEALHAGGADPPASGSAGVVLGQVGWEEVLPIP